MADVLKVAQLLLVQPSDTAVLAFRVACLAAGTAAPAWIAYKAAQAEASPKAKDRALRLAMAAALVELGEKALGAPVGLPRWRYWPSAKLALLLWLLLDGGKGADHVYAFVSRAMAPYEAEVDSVVDTAGPLLQHAAASYLSPIKAAAASCVAVCVAGFRLARARRERRHEQEQGQVQPRTHQHQHQQQRGPQLPSMNVRQPRWPPEDDDAGTRNAAG